MEVEIEGATYRIGKIPARDQFHLARKLAPMIGSMIGEKGEHALLPFFKAIGEMTEADADFLLFGLLKVVTKKLDNGLGWAPLTNGTFVMYGDLGLDTITQIAWESFNHNFASFLAGLRGAGNPGETRMSAASNG